MFAEQQEIISRGRGAQETVLDREQSGTPGLSLIGLAEIHFRVIPTRSTDN